MAAGPPSASRLRTSFADNLYRARERAGLSQKEAAERAALTRPRLDKIEGGEVIPSLDILIRLAGTYSMSVGELVEGVTWKSGLVEDSGPAEHVVLESPKSEDRLENSHRRGAGMRYSFAFVDAEEFAAQKKKIEETPPSDMR